jgi:transketolase
MENLATIAKRIRLSALEQTVSKKKGHLGGTFSCVDLLVAIYYRILHVDPKNPQWPDRDRFILSKGHACLALYPILADLGFFDAAKVDSYGLNGGLGGQLDVSLPGIEWNTGSLGHAIGVATGIALAGKMDHKDYRVYVVVGDAECAEGSIWEAIMFAGEHNLANITCIVDRNRLSVTSVLDDDSFFKNLATVLPLLGWNYSEIDGHDLDEVVKALSEGRTTDRPQFMIANTIKGKGVSFMENGAKWHHSVPTEAELEIARKELNA